MWPLENGYQFKVYESKKGLRTIFFVEVTSPAGSIQKYSNLSKPDVDILYALAKLYRKQV
jgi:hypothetical protein